MAGYFLDLNLESDGEVKSHCDVYDCVACRVEIASELIVEVLEIVWGFGFLVAWGSSVSMSSLNGERSPALA